MKWDLEIGIGRLRRKQDKSSEMGSKHEQNEQVRQKSGASKLKLSSKPFGSGVRGFVPPKWTAVENNEITIVHQEHMSWKPDIYFSDGSWSGRSTLRITGRDTAQTERILMRLVNTSSLDQGKECFHVIHVLLSLLSLPMLYAQLDVLQSPYFAHGSGAPGYTVLIHGEYIMSTTEELLARLVNLENEAVQARQRQGSAEQALAAAHQGIQQLSAGGSAPTPTTGVIDTRTLGKPKTFTGQPSEWTTWQFTFKAFCGVQRVQE